VSSPRPQRAYCSTSMAPPVFFTADPTGRGPAPPDQAGASTEWLTSVFEKALFVSQDDRKLLFVRARTRANGAPVIVLTGATDATAASSEVDVSLAALRDTSASPHIAKVFLSVFNTAISLADEEVTATRARTGDSTVQKIIVARLKSDGVTTTRTQSTLNVASFLSLVAPKLTSVELVLQVEQDGGGAPPQVPAAAGMFPCARLRKLAALGAVVGLFAAGEPCMTWEDAAEFFSAAMGRQVTGRVAVASAATKLESKLVANSKTKAALKTALEVVRAAGPELSMAERGEMLAAQGIPSATPSPAAQARPAAKRKERAGRQPTVQVVEDEPSDGEGGEDGDESQGSDSYGSEEDDEADDPAPPATAPQAPRPGAHGQAAAEQRAGASAGASSGSSRKKKKSARRSGGVGSPETDLARLTPAGWKASQVARVLFSDPLLSEAATYAARPQGDSDSDPDDVAQQRVAFAVRRLKAISGVDWIPKEQVSSKRALQTVREQVFHLIASGPPGRRRDAGQAQPQMSHALVPADPMRRVLVDVEAPEPVVTLSTGAPDLASEFKAGAALPDVVERLHAGSGLLTFASGDDVGAGIRSAPEHLRLDLARAVGSNGRVDAAGERASSQNSMPSVVARMTRALVLEVKEALKRQPNADEAGFQHLYDKPARKLAEAAVCGQFSLQDYAREVAVVKGSRAPKSGSMAELKAAWRYLRVALAATASPLYNMQTTDVGLCSIDNRLGSTAESLGLEVAGVQGWLRRVLDTWSCTVAEFRQGGLEVPSLAACVQLHETNFQFRALTASVKEELGITSADAGRTGKGRNNGEASSSQHRGGKSRRSRDDQYRLHRHRLHRCHPQLGGEAGEPAGRRFHPPHPS